MSWSKDTKPTVTIEYLVSEALDFLMTEDNNYLITNQSTVFTKDSKSNATYTNDTK